MAITTNKTQRAFFSKEQVSFICKLTFSGGHTQDFSCNDLRKKGEKVLGLMKLQLALDKKIYAYLELTERQSSGWLSEKISTAYHEGSFEEILNILEHAVEKL